MRGIFWWIFGAFLLGNREENPPKNSNQNLGVSQPKSTLQGSSLDIVMFPIVSGMELWVMIADFPGAEEVGWHL